MPSSIYIVIAASGLLGLLFLWRGLANAFNSDLYKLRGFLQLVLSLAFIGTSAILLTTAFSLSTYKHFVSEKHIGTISFEPLHEPQRFIATLSITEELPRRYEVRGDEWQVDARIIKWDENATRLGLKPLYQLERLSGRYRDAKQDQKAEHIVNDLVTLKGVDFFTLARRYQQFIPFVDAEYGSATYLPISTDKSYDIYLSNSGLLARVQEPEPAAETDSAE